MKQQSIKKNYILNTSYQVFNILAPLITAPYISRVLGAEGVGIYSYTSSVVAFFNLIAVLGTTVYGQRVIAQSRDNRKEMSDNFWSIEILSLITTFICTVAWLVFALFNEQYKLYFFILTADLFAAAFDIIWFYSGIEQFNVIVIRNLAIKILSILFLVLFVRNKDQVGVYIAIMSFGKFLGNLSMWIPLENLVEPLKKSRIEIRPHIKETLKYFIPTAAASIYTYLDKVMIGNFTNTAVENGFYEQANKIIKVGYTILASINTVMMPRMSYLFAHDNEIEIKEKLEKTFAFIMTFGIPISVGIGLTASNFVPWFFGSEFSKTIILLNIGCPLALIMTIHNFLSAQYLIPSGQRVRSTKGVLIGAAVNLVLNLILIPKLQSVGAIISTVVAETSICIVYFYMSKEFVPANIIIKYLPKQLFASLTMGLAIAWIGKNQSGSIKISIFQVIAGVIIYFLILILTHEKFTLNFLNQLKTRLIRNV